MKKAISILLSMIVMSTFCLSACQGNYPVDEKVCFFDNATFSDFTDIKEEFFVITEPTDVHFIMRGQISEGQIYVKVYCEETGEVIFETSSLQYDKVFDKKLSAGKYCYVLEIKDCKNGEIYHKAEK